MEYWKDVVALKLKSMVPLAFKKSWFAHYFARIASAIPHPFTAACFAAIVSLPLGVLESPTLGQEPGSESNSLSSTPTSSQDDVKVNLEEGWFSRDDLKKKVEKTLSVPKDCKALHPTDRIWIERNDQVVICDGVIAQREAQLEMFACPSGTKEHESVVAVFSKSQLVHAGLLAVGAKPGSPATFEPFKPARGATIRVFALWYNDKGERQATYGQKWVRKMGTKDHLQSDWVFAGSKEYFDEFSKERHYLGDSGELICVANFGSSTLDLVVRSEQLNSNLAFETYLDRIPKRNTPIRLVLHLTEDRAHGSEAGDEKSEPKFLKEPVPEFILKYLEPKAARDAEAPAELKPADTKPATIETKSPTVKPSSK